MHKDLLDNIIADIYNLMGGSAGHGADHSIRVYEFAMKICDTEPYADRKIVTLASLLHDVDDYKFFGKESKDLDNARQIMKKYNITKDVEDRVIYIIKNMGFSKRLKGIVPDTIEGKIVSDADMLDAMGAIGMVRTIEYNYSKNGQFFKEDLFPELNVTSESYSTPPEKSSVVNHCFEKLLKIHNIVYTDFAKKEGLKRNKTMINFLKDFFEEQNAPEWRKFLDKYLENLGN